MADYIDFEARASDESDDGEIIAELNDDAMIDDGEQQNNDASFLDFAIKQETPQKF